MALTITHSFTSAIADDSSAATAGQVVPSNWNASHTITGQLAASDLSNGTTGTGAVVLATLPVIAGATVTAGLNVSYANPQITVQDNGTSFAFEDIKGGGMTGFRFGQEGSVSAGLISGSNAGDGVINVRDNERLVIGTNNTAQAYFFPSGGYSVGTTTDPGAGIINVATGYQVAGAPVACVLLNTLTPSNVASISDTTSFTSAYDNYLIMFENIVPVTDGVNFTLQVHSGGSFKTTNYLNISGLADTTDIRMTGIEFGGVISNTAGAGLSGMFNIFGVNATNTFKIARYQNTWYSSSSAVQTSGSGGVWNGGQGAVDGFQVLMTSGNISTGTIKIYGMK